MSEQERIAIAPGFERGLAEASGDLMFENAMRKAGWERVVRCRDCAHVSEHRNTLTGCPPTFYECRFFDLAEVEPDGFCAWGKRRDA